MTISREIYGKNIRRNNIYNDDVVSLLVYGGIGSDKGTKKGIFTDIKDLVIFAAMVGKRFNKTEKVDSRNSTGIIIGTFSGAGSGKGSRIDQHNVVFMFGLIAFKDMNYLRDEKIDSVITVFEEFSNGGLSIIKQWLIESGWNELILLEKISDELSAENNHEGVNVPDNPF